MRWWAAPAAVVTDGDQQLLVIHPSVQSHRRIWMIGWVGVFDDVGQGFVDGQGEVIHQGGGGTECL